MWPYPQESGDLVTLKRVLNRRLHFLWSDDDKNDETKDWKTSTNNQRFYSIYKSMLSYTKSENPMVAKTKREKPMLLSNCVVCGSEKSRFLKEQETSGSLSSLGIKAPLSQIPISGPVLF